MNCNFYSHKDVNTLDDDFTWYPVCTSNRSRTNKITSETEQVKEKCPVDET